MGHWKDQRSPQHLPDLEIKPSQPYATFSHAHIFKSKPILPSPLPLRLSDLILPNELRCSIN